MRRTGPSLTSMQALAARRAAFAGSALVATLTVHGAAAGAPRLLPVAPALWGVLLCGAVLCGSRGPVFRARAPLATLVLLLVAQAAMHIVLVHAPWALGVRPHHQLPLLTGAALAGHVAVGSLLAVVLVKGERILTALTHAAVAVRRFLHGRMPSRPVAPTRVEAVVAAAPPPVGTIGTPARGPPLAV